MKNSYKMSQNVLPTYFSTVQNLRLGSIELENVRSKRERLHRGHDHAMVSATIVHNQQIEQRRFAYAEAIRNAVFAEYIYEIHRGAQAALKEFDDLQRHKIEWEDKYPGIPSPVLNVDKWLDFGQKNQLRVSDEWYHLRTNSQLDVGDVIVIPDKLKIKRGGRM